MAKHPLDMLFAEIKARKRSDPEKSYTAKLLQGGPPKIAKKLGEEATEAIIASLVEDNPHFVAECADVLYHLLVLIAARGATPAQVYAQLIKRRGQSGLDEKASRKPAVALARGPKAKIKVKAKAKAKAKTKGKARKKA
jgi:phosphoribosyl-ATP pyrophosphohydrolase